MNPIPSTAVLAALIAAVPLSAETLVEYTFGTSSSTSNATTTGTNVTTAAFTRGGGLPAPTFSTTTGSPSARSIFVTSAAVDEAVSATSTDWLGFTISATPGNEMKLSSLSFYYAYSNTSGTTSGSATFDVRSSVDNYASSLAAYTLDVVNSTTPNWTLASISLTSLPSYQGLDTVSFRVFLNDGANASTNSQLRLDTVNLAGVSAAPVPEPSAFAAVAGLAVLGCAALRRRR